MAQAARDAFGLDEVLLAPTGRQPLKRGAGSAPFGDRLAMVELLCAGVPGLTATAIDGPRADGAANYTIDTLRRLQEQEHEQTTLFVIVGADSFLDLPRWRDPVSLLRVAEWIVVSRPGFATAQLHSIPLLEHDAGRIHLLEDVAVPLSATGLRERLRAGEQCADALTPAVLDYIDRHHLYER